MDKTAVKQLLNTVPPAQAQERMNSCFCNPDGYTYEWSLITDSITWGGTLHKKLGYNKTCFPKTLNAWENKMIHPADYKRIRKIRHHHLKTGDVFCTHYRVKQKNGKYVPITSHGIATVNSQGTPYKWKGCIQLYIKKCN